MRFRHGLARLSGRLLAGCAVLVALPTAALAQAVEITPQTSVTPTKTVQPWIYQMAVGAVILGVIIVVAIAAAYLRFSPKFFGREGAARPAPPGSRPRMLTRQIPGPATAGGVTAPAQRPPPAERPAPAARQPASAATATAVAERPASAAAGPAEAPPAQAAPAVAASSAEPTAGPSGETAVQSDAVGQTEAVAPEARPTAKAPEETGTVAETTPAQPAPSHGGAAAMDQETFDRVLKEQLDKGVDRRVAEGRARAAAVVAARKKAQG